MKNFIEINFFSKKFLYIIFLGLFELIRSLFTKYFLNDYYCPFFMNFLMFCGEATLIIFYFIEKKLLSKLSRKKGKIIFNQTGITNNISKLNQTITLFLENQKIKIKKHNDIFFIFICMLGDYISFLFQTISKITGYPLCVRDLYILISMFFCYYLLKFRYYKHHIFSVILVAIGIIIKFIIQILSEKNILIWLIGLLIIVGYISMAIQECLEKKIIHYDYFNPNLLVSIEGFMGMFVSLFIIIFTMRIKDKNYNDEITIYFRLNIYNDKKKIIYLIIYYFLNIVVNFFRIKVIYEFDPCHKTVCYILVDILRTIINIKNENENKNFYYYFISYPFTLIGFLIFNELIIVKLFNLHYNTNKYINKRSNLDNLNYNNNYIYN